MVSSFAPVQPDWDALATQFCTTDFIPADPIWFPHQYQHNTDWRDAECIAFIAALFSYGRRDKIKATLREILPPLGDTPVSTLMTASTGMLQKSFQHFYYRFNTAQDLVFLLQRLSEIYQTEGSLKQLWIQSANASSDLKSSIHQFRQRFLYSGTHQAPLTYGMKFLFADPMKNSAAKRFNMFLRWMVRHDAVDLGLWSDVLATSELKIPLDTHVAAMARQYQITTRLSNDWRTVEEITDYFRQICPNDPVRYDFALFGLGLEQSLA